MTAKWNKDNNENTILFSNIFLTCLSINHVWYCCGMNNASNNFLFCIPHTLGLIRKEQQINNTGIVYNYIEWIILRQNTHDIECKPTAFTINWNIKPNGQYFNILTTYTLNAHIHWQHLHSFSDNITWWHMCMYDIYTNTFTTFNENARKALRC